VINVGLVERVARRAVAKARASVVDDVVARRVAVNSREVRMSFHNHVWANHHNWSTANAQNELPSLHNHVSRSRRTNPRRCRAEGARGVFVGRSATGGGPTGARASLVAMQVWNVWCACHCAVSSAPNREHGQQRERCAPLHCPFGRTLFLGGHAARGVCVTCGLWSVERQSGSVRPHTGQGRAHAASNCTRIAIGRNFNLITDVPGCWHFGICVFKRCLFQALCQALRDGQRKASLCSEWPCCRGCKDSNGCTTTGGEIGELACPMHRTHIVCNILLLPRIHFMHNMHVCMCIQSRCRHGRSDCMRWLWAHTCNVCVLELTLFTQRAKRSKAPFPHRRHKHECNRSLLATHNHMAIIMHAIHLCMRRQWLTHAHATRTRTHACTNAHRELPLPTQ
jgi:hypothetical protein